MADLVPGGLPKAHLAPVDQLVVEGPTWIAELLEQDLGHVLEAGRPVEVHEHGTDRKHGARRIDAPPAPGVTVSPARPGQRAVSDPVVYSATVTVLGGEPAVPCTRNPLQRG